MKFKNRVKQLRQERDISPAELAVIFEPKKSEAAIRAWELGRSKPDADTLIALAKYFDCSTDYLLGLSEYRTLGDALNMDARINRVNSFIDRLSPEDKEPFLAILEDIQSAYSNLIDYIDLFSGSFSYSASEKNLLTNMFHAIRTITNGIRQICDDAYIVALGVDNEAFEISSDKAEYYVRSVKDGFCEYQEKSTNALEKWHKEIQHHVIQMLVDYYSDLLDHYPDEPQNWRNRITDVLLEVKEATLKEKNEDNDRMD